jgi:hypothetical protein
LIGFMTFKMAAAKLKTKVKACPELQGLLTHPELQLWKEGILALNCMTLCHRKCYGKKACPEMQGLR